MGKGYQRRATSREKTVAQHREHRKAQHAAVMRSMAIQRRRASRQSGKPRDPKYDKPSPGYTAEDVHAMFQEDLRVGGDGSEQRKPAEAFQLATSGPPRPVPYQQEMEAAFGASFSHVEAYVGDPKAQAGLADLGARGAAFRAQIAFAEENPKKELVAHELTHVVQAGEACQLSAKVSQASDQSEVEARRVAAQVAAGQPAGLVSAAGDVIHRDPPTDPDLTTDQQALLIGLAGRQLNRAFTAFTGACGRVSDSVRERARHDAEVAGLIINIATGFLMPGLTRWAVSLVGNLPLSAPVFLQRVAQHAVDGDYVNQTVDAAMSAGRHMLMGRVSTLFAETETDEFITALNVSFQEATQELDKSLLSLDSESVALVYAAFDASVANEIVYTDEIDRLVTNYQEQVLPIGDYEPAYNVGTLYPGISRDTRVFFVNYSCREGRYALVRENVDSLGVWHDFITWISPEMESYALERSLALTGCIDVLHYNGFGAEVPGPPSDWPEPLECDRVGALCVMPPNVESMP